MPSYSFLINKPLIKDAVSCETTFSDRFLYLVEVLATRGPGGCVCRHESIEDEKIDLLVEELDSWHWSRVFSLVGKFLMPS